VTHSSAGRDRFEKLASASYYQLWLLLERQANRPMQKSAEKKRTKARECKSLLLNHEAIGAKEGNNKKNKQKKKKNNSLLAC